MASKKIWKIINVTIALIAIILLWIASTAFDWKISKKVAYFSLGIGAVIAFFALLMTFELLRGLELPNCGCFGVFYGRPLTWISPLEDVLLIYLSTYILKFKK